MRVEDFEAPGYARFAGRRGFSLRCDLARRVHREGACFACFGALEECGSQWVDSVSMQEFKERVETDYSSRMHADWETLISPNLRE